MLATHAVLCAFVPSNAPGLALRAPAPTLPAIMASESEGVLSALNGVVVEKVAAALDQTPLAAVTQLDFFAPVCSVVVLFAAAALVNSLIVKTIVQLVLGALLSSADGKGDIPDDRFTLGRKLGSGSYGAVYEGTASGSDGPTAVIKAIDLRKAGKFADSELYCIKKLQLCGQSKCMASFKGSYYDRDALNLVFDYEGTLTLDDAMKGSNFPWNLEESLTGKTTDDRSTARKAALIRKIAAQLFGNLAGIHGWSIVHRDVKGANMILSERERRFKLVDFGAACDVFTKTNYDPTQQLLDPDFCPPEGTLWRVSGGTEGGFDLAAAGKFDVYSAALVVMQMCFPSYRGNSGLKIFRNTLERDDTTLKEWREAVEDSKGFQEGLEILDTSGGFALLEACLREKPSQRISSQAAARSPFCLGA